ncbi:MAG: DUF3024 domain-containing protein, partial [Coriobacteriia bacterium]|nr:DUF3024 domain-containing protein [Coriobacteriia bacterium]
HGIGARMSFSEAELEAIDGALHGLCSHRVPEQHRDQIRIDYLVDRHSVILFEDRPHWPNPALRIREPFAKFRYYRSRGEWNLYWLRSDGNWHRYEPASPARKIDPLVRHVERDTYGCFFG